MYLLLERFNFHNFIAKFQRVKELDFSDFKAKFDFTLKTNEYTLSTAKSNRELQELFKIRHQLFLGGPGIDCDIYDHFADHLVITSNVTGEICGTYRLLCSETLKGVDHPGFYSETEFNLDRFLKSPGIKIELGRACVKEDHRNGRVIDLLWKGIAAFVKHYQADYLFGCSSMEVISKPELYSLYKNLKEKDYYSDEFQINPLKKFHYIDSTIGESYEHNVEAGTFAPLIRSYILAGARLYGTPAHDKDFDCLDFMTILKLDQVSSSFKRRYFH